MVELLSGYNHVLPFLASSYSLCFSLKLSKRAWRSAASSIAIDLLGTDAMTMNRKVFLALGDTCLMHLVIIRATVFLRHI